VTDVPGWWPAEVHPPGSPDWERSAVAWLLDQLPGDWREHEVLRRHPVVLARLAAGEVAGSLEATRAGWRTLRRDVGRRLPPEVVEEVMAAYERQGARFNQRTREIDAVRQALDGKRWVPGAGRWTAT
jgi:hypothetical protein